MKGWLIEYLLKGDYMVIGISMRLFVAAAVLQVILAPMWDICTLRPSQSVLQADPAPSVSHNRGIPTHLN